MEDSFVNHLSVKLISSIKIIIIIIIINRYSSDVQKNAPQVCDFLNSFVQDCSFNINLSRSQGNLDVMEGLGTGNNIVCHDKVLSEAMYLV